MSAGKTLRKSISKKTRFEVFKRDGFACQYCGAHPPSVLLHIDHVIAVASGGSNKPENLVTACEPCNLGKGARPLNVASQPIADRAKEIAEREAQLLGYQAIFEAKRQRLEDETWRVLHLLFGPVESVQRDHFNSTQRFVEKLGVHQVLEAADIALGASIARHKLFRYFCGICWSRVRGGT